MSYRHQYRLIYILISLLQIRNPKKSNIAPEAQQQPIRCEYGIFNFENHIDSSFMTSVFV